MGAPLKPAATDIDELAGLIVAYFTAVKRDLPWRRTRDPYAIWVSEIMLQQTRIATVIPYFERWMARFPTVAGLAGAPLDEVLSAWSGLGYYSRARNLHRGAEVVVERFGGQLPDTVAALREIPGIGPYTAGAIASIAFGRRAAVVDGNVARVLARLHVVDGDVKSSAVTRELWRLAARMVPEGAPGDCNQGLMELGQSVCTPSNPSCLLCPLRDHCRARAAGLERILPRMSRRKNARTLPLLETCALWAVRRKRVLLAKRSPNGLFGGLWELPQSDSLSAVEKLIPGARLLDLEPIIEHRQTLSHRRLHIRVYPAEVRGRLAAGAGEQYEKLAWQALDAADERGLAAATRAIIDALGKEETWSSTTKP